MDVLCGKAADILLVAADREFFCDVLPIERHLLDLIALLRRDRPLHAASKGHGASWQKGCPVCHGRHLTLGAVGRHRHHRILLKVYLYLRVRFYFHAVGLRAVRILRDASCHFSSVHRPPADAVAFLCRRRKHDLRALGPGYRGGCDALCPDLSRVFQLAAVSVGVIQDAAIADLACVGDGAVHHVVAILGQVIELDLLHISCRHRLASVVSHLRPVIHQHIVGDCDVQSQVVTCEALVRIPAVFCLYGSSVDLKGRSHRKYIRAVRNILKLKGDCPLFFLLKVHVYRRIFFYIRKVIRISGVDAHLVRGLYRFFPALGLPPDSPVIYHKALVGNCLQDNRLVLVQPSSGGKRELASSCVKALDGTICPCAVFQCAVVIRKGCFYHEVLLQGIHRIRLSGVALLCPVYCPLLYAKSRKRQCRHDHLRAFRNIRTAGYLNRLSPVHLITDTDRSIGACLRVYLYTVLAQAVDAPVQYKGIIF